MSESNIIGNGKAGGLVAYLDMLVDKGRAPAPTIANLKTAFKAVMTTVDGDNWADADIRGIDLDDYMLRFQNKTPGKYNEASYNTYRTRIGRCIEWYLRFLQTPGWAPALKQTRAKKAPKAKPAKGRAGDNKDLAEISEGEIVSAEGGEVVSSMQKQPTAAKLMGYPFPLEDGTIATLYLPPAISENDSERLQAFIKTLLIRKGA